MTDISSWYNDPEYSDLTLQLGDSRKIKVHKVVLCKRNTYFDSLCGRNSSFSEAKQSVIELKEDDPDAIEEVLRTIYGSPESHALSRPWRYWLNVILTADKYFELGLGETAQKNLQKVSNARDVDEVLDIIQAIQRELQHLSSMLTFASDLRKKNILGLHKNARYRDLLFKDRELVGSHFDELSQIMVPKTWLCKSCTNETGIDPFSMR